MVGQISDKLPNELLEKNVYKILKSGWYSLSTMLQWTNITSVISKWGKFLPFLSSVILLSMIPSNFIVSGFKSLI